MFNRKLLANSSADGGWLSYTMTVAEWEVTRKESFNDYYGYDSGHGSLSPNTFVGVGIDEFRTVHPDGAASQAKTWLYAKNFTAFGITGRVWLRMPDGTKYWCDAGPTTYVLYFTNSEGGTYCNAFRDYVGQTITIELKIP